jgi:hypothetical protein
VTAEPAGCWNAQYIADVTIPDGTRLERDERFTKTWRVRNTGECGWDNMVLDLTAGDAMGAREIEVPDAAPGETVEITAEMTAPSQNGRYRSEWHFASPTTTFDVLTLVIRVDPPPTATPRPVQPARQPQPTSPAPQPAAICGCSYSLQTSSDFVTRAAAQACYYDCVAILRGNIHPLDGNDNDGLACERRP